MDGLIWKNEIYKLVMCQVENVNDFYMPNKDYLEKIIYNDLSKVVSSQIVYHYSDFNTSVEQILLKRNLKFSKPSEFNDPFDCNEFLINFNYSEEQIEKTLFFLSDRLSKAEQAVLKQFIKDRIANHKYIEEEIDRFKLASFSILNDEVLMWSYYGDKHRGICIGFNFPHIYEEKFFLYPVNYISKIDSLDGNLDIFKTILYWLTTKSIIWSHEKEIRAIATTNSKSSDKFELINYDLKFVKEIIFGYKVSNLDIQKTIDILVKEKFDIDKIVFKKMTIDKKIFTLKEIILNSAHNSVFIVFGLMTHLEFLTLFGSFTIGG